MKRKRIKDEHESTSEAQSSSNTKQTVKSKKPKLDGSQDVSTSKPKGTKRKTAKMSVSSSETSTSETVSAQDSINVTSQLEAVNVNSYDIFFNTCNLQSVIVEEVSLEGLDGITFETLCLRISVRTKSELPFPNSIRKYIWEVLQSRPDISFYKLQNSRKKFVLQNYYGEENETSTLSDIYPFTPVNEDGIMGSAESYKSREDISVLVRNMNLFEADINFGSRLVMVASQRLRENSICHPLVDPIVDLKILAYCILERIARARYTGEVTVAKSPLQLMCKDPKNLFYYRKILHENFFITKQSFYVRVDGGYASTNILHAMRFYNKNKSRTQEMTEQVVELLRSQPNYLMDYTRLRAVFGNNDRLTKLFKLGEFQKFVKSDVCLYRELYPNADRKEWFIKTSNKERGVKVLRLKDPKVNIAGLWNEDENKEEAESDSEEQNEMIDNEGLCLKTYMFIKSSGEVGRTQRDISDYLSCGYYSTRTSLRKLSRKKLIYSQKQEIGRLRFFKYYAYEIKNGSANNDKINVKASKNYCDSIIDYTISSLLGHNTNEPLDLENTLEITEVNLEELIKSINEKCKSFEITPDVSKCDDSNYLELPDMKNIDTLHCRIREKMNDKYFCPIKLLSEWLYDIDSLCLRVSNITLAIADIFKDTSLSALWPVEKCESSTNETSESEEEEDICFEDNTNREDEKRELDDSSMSSKRTKLAEDEEEEEEESSVMRCFLGSKPMRVFHETDSDNIEVEIFESNLFGKIETLKDECLTQRTIMRMNWVAEQVDIQRVIVDLSNLRKAIRSHEKDEGYNVQIYCKSVYKITKRMIQAGRIKGMILRFKLENIKRVISVVCKPELDYSHPLILSAIERTKLRLLVFVKEKQARMSKQDKSPQPLLLKPVLTISVSKPIVKQSYRTSVPYKYSNSAGRQYGADTKFGKMHTLHQFLFYLVYDYPDRPPMNPESVRNEDLTAYNIQVGWKMFVTPLPQDSNHPSGWVQISDAIMRLPICLILQLHNVPFVVPEIHDYLNDPIKRNYLMKDVSSDVREVILLNRKYVFSIYEVFMRLCFIGLIQFGPQKFREKDQYFIYLNRNASILDTTSSAPGYHQVEKKEYKKFCYTFESEQDLEDYWHELFNICNNTNLNMRNSVIGSVLQFEEACRKPILLAAMSPQIPENASKNDDGRIPGDHLGAGGLDSSLWSSLGRNWFLSKTGKFGKSSDVEPKAMYKPPEVTKILPLEPPITPKRGIRFRKMFHRKDKKESRYKEDKIDSLIKMELKQSRPSWSYEEEKILTMSKILTLFLSVTYEKQMIGSQVIRDALHLLYKGSKNKTSTACLRKINKMFGKHDNLKYMHDFAKTLTCNSFIKKYFNDVVLKIHSNQLSVPHYILHSMFLTMLLHFYNNQHEINHLLVMAKRKYNLQRIHVGEVDEPIQKIENVPLQIEDSLIYYCTEDIMVKNKFKINKSFNESQILPAAEEDVNIATIMSLVQLVTGDNSRKKSSTSYRLFWLYHNFPDDLLRKSLAKARSLNMLAMPKNQKSFKPDKHIFPVFAKFITFSIYYRYSFISSFPRCYYYENHTTLLGILKQRQNLVTSNLPLDYFQPGNMSAIAELTAIDVPIDFSFEIPKQLVTLNSNLLDEPEFLKELARRYKRMLILTNDQEVNAKRFEPKPTRRKPITFRMIRSGYFVSDDEAEDTEVENEQFTKDVPKSDSITSLPNDVSFEDYEARLQNLLTHKGDITIELISDQTWQSNKEKPTKKPTETPTISQSAKKIDDIQITEVPEEGTATENNAVINMSEDEIVKEMMRDCPENERKVPKPSKLSNLLFGYPELDETGETPLNLFHEKFLVIFPGIDISLQPFCNEHFDYISNEYSKLCKKVLEKIGADIILNSTVPVEQDILDNLAQSSNTLSSDVEFCRELIAFIKEKQVLGASVKDIKLKFSDLTLTKLWKILEYLEETNILMRVGIDYTLYVHYDYRKSWFTNTINDNNAKNDQDISSCPKMIPYPWSCIDGTLNYNCLIDWMCSVFGQCMGKWAAPLALIINHCHLLRPTYVHYIMMRLQDIGCLRMYKLTRECQSMFTSSISIEEVPALPIDDFHEIYYEIDDMCSLKFGAFLNKDLEILEFKRSESFRHCKY